MSAIDYDKLVRSINTCLESKSLSNRFLDPSHIVLAPGTNLIVGGFGDVQQAFYRLPGQQSYRIALKKLRPQGDWSQRVRVIAGLVRELRVWGDLQHPNILRLGGFYYDVSTLDCAWIITLWQENGNVLDYIAKVQPDAAGRLKLALDTALGLAYLHSRQPPVCHADIKPENTLVDREGKAMLCDFGLSRMLDNESSGLTTTSTPKITLWYTSPEILNNSSRHTLASDVWAWGCLLLHIITDLRPYAAYNATSVVLAIATGKPPANLEMIEMRDFIASALSRCWDVTADRRPPMKWCSDVLLDETTNLFNTYCQFEDEELDGIPLEYRAKCNGWLSIRNPSSEKVYEFDFVLSTLGERPLSFAFSPDNTTVAVVNGTRRVNYYDVESGREQSEVDYSPKLSGSEHFPDDDTGVCAICFGHLGSLLATGHRSGAIMASIWNFPTPTIVCELKSHEDHVQSVIFVLSDTILVSQYPEDSVCTWDVKRGTLLHEFQLPGVWGVVGSPHHPFFVILDGDDPTTLCDAELGGYARLATYLRPPADAVFLPDGSKFITDCKDEGLAVWNLQPLLDRWDRRLDGGDSLLDGEELELEVTSLDGPRAHTTSVSVSSDGQLSASGLDGSDRLVLWDLATGQAVMQMRGDMFHSADEIAFGPGSHVSEGQLAYVGDNSKAFHLVHYKVSL